MGPIVNKWNSAFSCLLLLVWCGLIPASTGEWYHIVEKSPQRLLIEITAPPLSIDTLATDAGDLALLSSSSWPILDHPQWPAVPFQTLLIDWPVQSLHMQVVSAHPEEYFSVAPLAVCGDVPVTGAPVALRSWQREMRSGPISLAEVTYAGAAGQQRLWQLRIFPYRYEYGSARVARTASMRLELTGSGAHAFSCRPAVRGASDLQVAAPAALSHPQGSGASSFTAPGRVRFLVEEEGWYRVTGADLRKAGIDLFDIAVDRMRLSCGGKDVPFYYNGEGQFDQGESIEFFGTELRLDAPAFAPDLYQDPYSITNVYWLSWEGSPGPRMETEYSESESLAGQAAQIPYAFYHTIHVEQNGHFDHLYDVYTADSLRDHWLYDSGINAGSKRSYPFSLHHADARSLLPVQVRVMMTGLTTDNEDVHRAAIFLNDRFAARGTGIRQGIMDLQSQEDNGLLAAYLSSGENTLTVVNEFEPTQTDYFALNWFEVTYPRLYRADEGYLEFTIPPEMRAGFFKFTLDGFSDQSVEIYKLGASKIAGATMVEATGNDGQRSVRVQFYDTVPSHQVRYVAVSASAKKSPLRIEGVQPQWQPASRDDIDYVVIAPRSFLTDEALPDLLRHRQNQGHQVAGIRVEDIFTYLNHGRRSPHAIKAFLKWAVQRWPLQYCLLAGDGSFLRNPVQGDTLDLVPVYMRQTLNYGAASSDNWYSLLEGEDEIPDLYIGRLPARTPEQLRSVVDKIIAHETNTENGEWHNRLLFIGGNGWVFREKGIALAQKVPPAWSSSMLFTTQDPGRSPDPYYGNTPELFDYMEQGCGVINFHGHGGGAIWSDNGLLGLDDVGSLNNKGRYPVILSMTCFTGAFEQPTGDNLAETMLFAPEKGTMAFFGASGFGWRDNDDYLQSAIMTYLYDHPQATLGEVLTAGKIRYFSQFYGSIIAQAEVNQYILFGDPAMRMRLPSRPARVEISNPLVSGDESLSVSINWPFAPGIATLEMETEKALPGKSTRFSFDQSVSRLRLAAPAPSASRQGTVRLYGVDELGLQQSHGAALFSFDQAFFDSLRVLPSTADSLQLFIMLRSRNAPERVICYFRGDSLAMRPAQADWYMVAVKSWWQPISCSFRAYFSDGSSLRSATYAYEQARQLDVEALTWKVSWGGEERPLLLLPLMNWGDGAGTVIIRMEYWRTQDYTWNYITSDTITVTAHAGATASFPIPAPREMLTVRFLIDAGQEGVLQARSVVTSPVYALEPGAGFRFLDVTGDTLPLDERAACIASAFSVHANSALRVIRHSPALLKGQPDYTASSTIPAYELHFSRPESIDQGVLFSYALADSGSFQDNLHSASVFYFAGATSKWIRIPSMISASHIAASIQKSGLYTILWASDQDPPHIDATFDGRPYVPNTFVNRKPVIALHLQDQNGIDIAEGKLQILLDGQSLNDESWVMPDSIRDGNLITLTLCPELQPGLHHLTVTASDCIGNTTAAQEFSFQVAEVFDLNLLGTYPNPFSRRMTFVYLLSTSAEKLSLKIYTAAGQLIREFDGKNTEDPDPMSADYHEITWDGTDDDGFEVANGVYFFRLTARSGNSSEEITGKIARIL